MNDKLSVSAVIVTYNRIELLKKSIASVLKQTIPVKHLIIVNNNSNDGTAEYIHGLSKFDSRIKVINLQKNYGGAGGFYTGIKEFYNIGDKFVWLMDDDTIPTNDALEKMLFAVSTLNNQFGFLCSNVRWTDGTPALMNIPRPKHEWTTFANDGLIELVTGSFVSMLISRETINKVGLPISEFFIWGDDLEYSERISRIAPSYFVSDSIIIHEMGGNIPVNIVDDSPQRLNRYYYNYRNLFYVSRKRGKKELVKYSAHTFRDTLSVVRYANNNKFKRLRLMWKGFFAGIFFHPSIKKV